MSHSIRIESKGKLHHVLYDGFGYIPILTFEDDDKGNSGESDAKWFLQAICFMLTNRTSELSGQQREWLKDKYNGLFIEDEKVLRDSLNKISSLEYDLHHLEREFKDIVNILNNLKKE